MFWQLYFISIVENIQTTFGVLGWILLIVYSIVCFILLGFVLYYRVGYGEDDDDYIKSKEVLKWFLKKIYIWIFCFVFISICMLMPSKKDLLIIYGVTKFSESKIFEQTNEITQKSLLLLNKQLDKYLEENKKE
ncbi:MAG TPA: hypothetical protein VGB37_10195 [Candidatus Lokiarchaeia archaeon]